MGPRCGSCVFIFAIFNLQLLNPPVECNTLTTILQKNSKAPDHIDLRVVSPPKNLLIGRCVPEGQILHAENIVLLNDKIAKVNATIMVNIDGDASITCVKVLDANPEDKSGYPYFLGGGVGYNFIEVGVTTGYGEGFNFYFEIQGYGNRGNNSSSKVYVNKPNNQSNLI